MGEHSVHPPADPGAERLATIHRFFGAIQAGEYSVLEELLTPEAVTRWPQSHELITGAMACVRVYENYPGGPPAYRVQRVTGVGHHWVAELVGDYGDDRWYMVSIVEFEGSRIARMTDYFGPTLPAPEWRAGLVEREEAATS